MRLRKLTKWVAGGSLLALALSVNPDATQGQFPARERGERGGGQGGPGGPGGGGGMQFRMGGGFSADSMFDRMRDSTGATTGDVVDYSRLPPDYRERTNRLLQMSGQPPLPTSGTITRDQYRQQFAQQQEAMRSRFGGMGGQPGGGRMMMAAPGSNGAMQMTVTPGSTPGSPNVIVQPQGGPPQWGGNQSQWGGNQPQWGGGGPGGPGGWNPAQMTDEQVARMMRRYDRDQDGRISLEEAQRNDGLRDSFQRYDADRNGFIDVAEYRAYNTERMGAGDQFRGRGDRERGGFPGGGQPGYNPQFQQYQGGFDPNNPSQQGGGPGGPGGWGGPGGGWDRGRDSQQPPAEQEEPRPVVYRYGKLPQGLPSWFTSLDDDKDGQIGLYEWRKGGKSISEYISMDLNKDGLLTAEEYLRFKKDRDGGDTRPGGGSAASMFGGEGGSSGAGGPGGRSFGPPNRGNGGNRGNEASSSREERPREERRNGNGNGGNPFRNR